MKELVKYVSFLRKEYDKLCDIPDRTIKENACREVCKEMFNGLSYGLNEYKLQMLHNTLETYRLLKQNE